MMSTIDKTLPNYPLWSVQGLEIEYMIVDRQTLAIKPICDQVLRRLNHGVLCNEINQGLMAISNELALHVIEIKTLAPWPKWLGLADAFHQQVQKINYCLDSFDACLLPSAAHPFANPKTDILLWPHDHQEIYNAYHHLFNCQGHGWGNLQSTHINLPFNDEQSFYQLHNAIRYLLPIIPALTASSPCLDGRVTDFLDSRLVYYGKNQRRFPIISGQIIPEFIRSPDDYQAKILQPIYDVLASVDPEGILQHEWVNSRGAIARFDRLAIEIRIMDSQEAPCMDVACAAAIKAVLQYICDNCPACYQDPLAESDLHTIYQQIIKAGANFSITDKTYLQHLLGNNSSHMTAKKLWVNLLERAKTYLPKKYVNPLVFILNHGSLAERLRQALTEQQTSHQHIVKTYQHLAQCLATNHEFLP